MKKLKVGFKENQIIFNNVSFQKVKKILILIKKL